MNHRVFPKGSAMTATADFTIDHDVSIEPVRMTGGARMLVRLGQRLLGASLAMAAVGLWLAPGASWESDIMLFKLILSLTAILAGFGLMTASVRPAAPEIQIDTIRREVRLVRRDKGQEVLLQSSSFADLAHAEFDGTNVQLWDAEGQFLAEVALTDRKALNSLIAGLRDAGKLD